MTMDSNTTYEGTGALKALAHPTRLQIVAELLGGTKRVTDIQEILSTYQTEISRHLAVLRHAGLVNFFQDGFQRYYYVSRPRLVEGIVTLLTEGEPVLSKSKSEIDREKWTPGARAACVFGGKSLFKGCQNRRE